MSHIKRRANILVNGVLAGSLTEYQNGNSENYEFQYLTDYISAGSPIGFHFPLTEIPYKFDELPPFFLNLASEGWLKKIQCEKGGINEDDTFGLLLANGKELIGALSIINDEP